MDRVAHQEFTSIPEIVEISPQSWIRQTTAMFLSRRDKRARVLDGPLERHARQLQAYRTFCGQVRAELQSGGRADRSLALMQELERRFNAARTAFEELRTAADELGAGKRAQRDAVDDLNRQIELAQLQFNAGQRAFARAREERAQAFLRRVRASQSASEIA